MLVLVDLRLGVPMLSRAQRRRLAISSVVGVVESSKIAFDKQKVILSKDGA